MKDARDNSNLYGYEHEPCKHCGKYKTYEGHDSCIGELDGIINACCGHGKEERAYIQFFDGTGVYGKDAIMIQDILKKKKFDSSFEDRTKSLKGSVEFLEENKFEYFKSN